VSGKLQAYLVDDEPLALDRLRRLLEADGRAEVAGQQTDPARAVEELPRVRPDVLFLDVQMPVLDGFALLERLPSPVRVVFVTAHDDFAVKAFEVASVDYLLKPVTKDKLARALDRVQRAAEAQTLAGLRALLEQARAGAAAPLERLPSRVGQRTVFVELAKVSHFFAEDKLTFAATEEGVHTVDFSIAQLEQRLDAARYFRIHRGTLVSLAHVAELVGTADSGVRVRMAGPHRTELSVARDRVRELKRRLGMAAQDA
jgi:two-component system LytT family response regulator